jgi:hypothetical protein
LTKGRLIYVLLIASLFAYAFGCFNLWHLFGHGMSDGGGH